MRKAGRSQKVSEKVRFGEFLAEHGREIKLLGLESGKSEMISALPQRRIIYDQLLWAFLAFGGESKVLSAK